MALHFVIDDADAGLAPGDTVALTGAEAHHAATVRRVRAGETVTIGDGRGLWAQGRVESVAARSVEIVIDECERMPKPERSLALVQALAKGDRDELAVQAATEIGVDRIVPWQAGRSVSRWEGPKREKGVERWRSIAREAGKQAHRAWLPVVDDVVSTKQLIERLSGALIVVLDPWVSASLSSVLAESPDAAEIALVVGPEGGIAPEELAALEASGAVLARLGDTVLRTSTAGPAALAVASVALGRW